MLELLVVIAIIGVLAAILMPVIGAVRSRARAADCSARVRSLAQAILLSAEERRGDLPRSFHSSATYRQTGWAAEIASVLGRTGPESSSWNETFNQLYRCPVDESRDVATYSYALNVHFELDPSGDDYAGSPATWRRLSSIPTPSRTVLLAEPRPVAYGDHIMAHLWSGLAAARNALVHDRHSGRANYAFCDGHVAALRVEQTFDPSQTRNLWNPSMAR